MKIIPLRSSNTGLQPSGIPLRLEFDQSTMVTRNLPTGNGGCCETGLASLGSGLLGTSSGSITGHGLVGSASTHVGRLRGDCLPGAKMVDSRAIVNGTRAQDGKGEGRTVDGVWKILGLQAKASVASEPDAAGAFDTLNRGKIAGVELDTRLVGQHFHDPTAGGILQYGGKAYDSGGMIEDEIVVVSGDRKAGLVHAITDDL